MYDGFAVTDPDLIGTFPSMYQNALASEIMSMQNGNKLWGPFVWYDMFTWRGLWNFIEDAFWLDIAVWWEVMKAMTRATTNDWQYETVELKNFVDMNRLWVPDDYIDPYNL